MNIGIILLAGQGKRMGGELPKQFLNLNNEPLFLFPVRTFVNCDDIDYVVLVTSDEYVQFVKDQIKKHSIKKIKGIVIGGKTRQESVRNALTSLKANEDDIVLIHDSARIFINEKIIKENIEAVCQYGAAVTALKSKDSVFKFNGKINYLNRDEIYQIQTPQSFYFKDILSAHLKYKNEVVTDDASLLIKDGKQVKIVDGDSLNFKITTKEDYLLAISIVSNKK